jgi:dipeptidyl aminopeptidase/acylaminoacyl peptidase
MAVAASGGEPRKILDSSGFLRQYSPDHARRLAACIHEDNTLPDEIALVNVSTGEIRTLVNVNPEFQNLQLSPAQRIDVSDKRGERFWGHVVLPLGYEPGKRYPLIIATYRDYDGFLRGGVGDEYPIQVFAANGFAVLNFDAISRTRNTKPGDFDRTMLLWQAPVEAMEAAVAKLSEMGTIDSSRVGIAGLSFGATLVDYGISHTTLFRAAIDSGGGSWDPIMYYVAGDEFRTGSMSRWQNLESPDGSSLPRWQKLSTALNASRVHAALLINAADAEYIHDMQMVTTLRDLKKPIEMFIYVDERHIKNQPKHRHTIYERNVDWFNFWLRDKEDPDPAKAEQYKRWRELRELQKKDEAEPAAVKP